MPRAGDSAGLPRNTPTARGMIMTYQLYILALVVAAASSAGLALFAWRRRPTPGSTELSLLLLAIALWSLATGLEAAADQRTAKLICATVSYIGSQTAPVLVFLFAVRYTQRDGWLTPGRTALLFVVPSLSVIMAATNEWHRLLWIRCDPAPRVGRSRRCLRARTLVLDRAGRMAMRCWRSVSS